MDVFTIVKEVLMSSVGGVSQGSGYQSLYGKISSGKALQSAADGAM